MGSQLVAKVFATWAPHVGDKAFRVLMRMAHTALDTPTEEHAANLYWAHPDLVAAAMGGTGTLQSRGRLARLGIEELIERGALERVNRARTGSRQVYRLTLDNEPVEIASTVKPRARPKHWRPVKGQSSDAPNPPGSDAAHPPGSDAANPEVRMPPIHPRNQEEPQQELSKEYAADLVDVDHSTVPPDEASENIDCLEDPSTTDNSNTTNTVVKEAGPPTTREIAPCGDETCIGGVRKLTEAPWIAYCPTCRPAPVPALDA